MVNPSNVASLAGAAAGAAVGPEVAAATIRRAATRATTAGARARTAAASTPPSPRSLLEQLLLPRLRSTPGVVVPRGGRSSAVPGYAPAAAAAPRTATSSAATRSSTSASSLAFLSDPKLSIEEKLMRLLAYLNDKYEKEMQAKMNEIAGKPASTSSSTKKKSSGILGKVASAVSGVVGADTLKAVSGFLKLPGVKSALGKVAGPILAAGASALGFPAAAPLLLAYGSKVVDVVGSVASAGASASSSSAASGTSATGGTDGKSDQLMMMELQRLQEKQQQMFGLVSNILKNTHDTRMGAINNMR